MEFIIHKKKQLLPLNKSNIVVGIARMSAVEYFFISLKLFTPEKRK